MREETMVEKTSRRIWDRGKVYKDGEPIAEVVYALQVVQETVGGVEQQDITGQVRVVEGKRNLISEGPLVLYLGGGHKWEFLASIDMGSGVYSIVGTSKAGLVPS
jgi:predicted RNA-binding protein